MRALVTGAAGFIGSTLTERLLDEGHEVVGVDSFTLYYDRNLKESNLAGCQERHGFRLVERDLARDDVTDVLSGVTDVFHQAGQPGVRASWGPEFAEYVQWNIIATQRLLEAVRVVDSVESFVFASSSSVYGRAERFPTDESVLPAPISPYGVTKLAAEHLCSLYGDQLGVPTVSLRYFTVYGPRQRPDMATGRLIRSALLGDEFQLIGTGEQIRDFTFVDDIVAANLLAARYCRAGSVSERVFNIGGGSPVDMLGLIKHVEAATGSSVNLVRADAALGDPPRTGADSSRARLLLGWEPAATLDEGLERHVEWVRAHARA